MLNGQEALAKLQAICPKDKDLKVEMSFFIQRVMENEKLASCTNASLFTCFYNALKIGASFEPFRNEIYLIPKYDYKTQTNKCTIEYTYKFIISKLDKNEMLIDFKINAVFENDIVEGLDVYNCVIDKHITTFNRGELIGAYCLIDWGKGKRLEILTKEDLEPILKAADKPYKTKDKDGKAQTWIDFAPEMAKKSVFKRCIKYIPIFAQDDELQEVVFEDNKAIDLQKNKFLALEKSLKNVDADFEEPDFEDLYK